MSTPGLRFPMVVLVLLGPALPAFAQPTYKLGVKTDLKPHATLALDQGSITRSPVADDPGFRHQYHFRKDGKTVATVEARARTRVAPPSTTAGTYTVVLETFYPDYKGGNVRKGEFRPISNVLAYHIEPGTPARVAPLPPEKPSSPIPPRPPGAR